MFEFTDPSLRGEVFAYQDNGSSAHISKCFLTLMGVDLLFPWSLQHVHINFILVVMCMAMAIMGVVDLWLPPH